MQQKWGTTVQNYAEEKGLTKKNIKKKTKKTQKKLKMSGFGFFNYIITYSVLFIFFS